MSVNRVFLVGAPKCGTTSLANWLGRHQMVQLAQSKEPGFFRTGERKWIIDAHFPDQFQIRKENDYMSDFDEYERQFSGATSEIWRLDASTDYFGDPGSSARIKELLKSDTVKVMCILRDPVERMYSEFCHTLRDNVEVSDFAGALQAEKLRIEQGFQPLFFHAERSRYWTHISRWWSVFGKRNMLLLPYTTLSDSAALDKKICNFLGIPAGEIGEIQRLNASVQKPEPHLASKINTLLRRNIKAVLGRAGQRHKVIYPDFTEEDKKLALSFIRTDVEQCMANPEIPTSDWATCYWLLSDA